jgi:hypothetical protein
MTMSRREARRWLAATCVLGATIVQLLVERGEVGEVNDQVTVAAKLAPDGPESWPLLSMMHAVGQ